RWSGMSPPPWISVTPSSAPPGSRSARPPSPPFPLPMLVTATLTGSGAHPAENDGHLHQADGARLGSGRAALGVRSRGGVSGAAGTVGRQRQGASSRRALGLRWV